MTAVTDGARTVGRLWRARMPATPAWPARLPKVTRVAQPAPPDPRRTVVSYALTLISATLLVLLVDLAVVSQLQHHTAQNRLYGELRLTLAEGSIPIGQLDVNGDLVEPGTPIALLDIPAMGVHEVVVEGTSARETKVAVGHRRDTPFPGQVGIAVLMGRAWSFGGVFKHLDRLQSGDTFTVTTGQGVSTYRVIGPRLGTVELPALAPDGGRLTLVTASGRPFQPGSTLRVDADLVSKAHPRPPVVIAPGILNSDEEAMAGDNGRMFSLSWLVQLLAALSVAAVWSWKRWSHPATWVVFVPLLTTTALACADRATDLLPNLL